MCLADIIWYILSVPGGCLVDIIWYVLSVPGGAFSRQYGTYWLFLGVCLADIIWYVLSSWGCV